MGMKATRTPKGNVKVVMTEAEARALELHLNYDTGNETYPLWSAIDDVWRDEGTLKNHPPSRPY